MNIILFPPDNPLAFSIFNIPIRWYGIVLSIAIFTGIIFSSYLVCKFISKKDYEQYLDFMPIIIIFAIIGARLFYVAANLEYYSKNIFEIFLINHGGISIYGAILFGLLAIFIYSKIYKFYLAKYLDIMAVTMPLCQSIGRWGNFFNQEAYGAPYDGAIKMYISEKFRYIQYKNIDFYHPTFLYESILDLLLFFILMTIFLKYKNIKTGVLCCLYLISYAIIRIIVESFRIDSTLNICNIPIATIISSTVAIVSVIVLIYIYKK